MAFKQHSFWNSFVGVRGLACVGGFICILVAVAQALAAPPSLPNRDVAKTITTTPTAVATAHNRTVLNVRNNSNPASGITIACRLGDVPAVHGAGSHDVFAGAEWSACADGFCSSDVLNCVAESSTVPATVLDY
jgi:hypothetical protein